MKFNIGHFPKGTIAKFEVAGQPTIVGIVAKIVSNGPNSYVAILRDRVCPLTGDRMSINISWCTQIIKRGEDVLWQFDKNRAILEAQNSKKDVCDKHPTKYNYYRSGHLLIPAIADKYKSDNSCVDYELLRIELTKERIIKDLGSWDNKIISKKKLNKAIKRLVNRCLIKKKKAQQIEDDYYNELYRDMDFNWD